MSYIEFIILGILQGITEFLPISSSGHLLMGRYIFNISTNMSESFVEVFLHGGTLLSILIYWKKDIVNELNKFKNRDYTYFLTIIYATIPAVIIALLFKEYINKYFYNLNNMGFLALSYLVLAIILFSTKTKLNYKYNKITYKIALLIGLAQCFAILPGISRSGITIAIAILLGVNNKIATLFSFMLAIPILFFTFLGSMLENFSLFTGSSFFWQLILGFGVSFIFGYIAIDILVKLIQKHKLWYFSFYCLLLSIILGIYNGL